MDNLHLNALQRAALDGLVRQFYETGAHTRHWDAVSLPLRGHYGTWSASNQRGIMSVKLGFRDTELGNFYMTIEDNQLSSWGWLLNSRDWFRVGFLPARPGGRQREPIPDDLFERLWTALHTACRRYIRHFKLQPQEYARYIFLSR